jgi:hypothetical protein
MVEVLVSRRLRTPADAPLDCLACGGHVPIAKQRLVETGDGFERRIERGRVDVGLGDSDVDSHMTTPVVSE